MSILYNDFNRLKTGLSIVVVAVEKQAFVVGKINQ